jgi:hypothetical protein
MATRLTLPASPLKKKSEHDILQDNEILLTRTHLTSPLLKRNAWTNNGQGTTNSQRWIDRNNSPHPRRKSLARAHGRITLHGEQVGSQAGGRRPIRRRATPRHTRGGTRHVKAAPDPHATRGERFVRTSLAVVPAGRAALSSSLAGSRFSFPGFAALPDGRAVGRWPGAAVLNLLRQTALLVLVL